MFQSLPCPGCHRTLVLVSETSLQAVLRCRHCAQQFVLGEMIQTQLGAWEVVHDPHPPLAKITVPVTSSDEKAVRPLKHPASVVTSPGGEVAEEMELELSAADEYVSPQSLMKKTASKKNVDWSKFEPITHEQYERMRRKGKSPLWSMLSVLLGGLASIPIAILLIWHLLGTDPLQVGPMVGRYAPWIVPIALQAKQAEFAVEDIGPIPPAGSSGFPRFDHLMEPAASDSKDSVENSADASSPPLSALVPPKSRERRVPRAFPMPTDSSVDAASADSPLAAAGPDMPTAPPENHVFAIINQVENSLQAWNERKEDRELQKSLAQQTYAKLSALALAIDQLPLGSPLHRLVRTELHSVGRSVAEHPDVQQLIQAGARYWLPNHKTEERIGLALVVEVGEVSEEDNVWHVTATPATELVEETALQIAVPKELTASITPGKKLLILGCVKSESANLQVTESSLKKPEPKLCANFVVVLES